MTKRIITGAAVLLALIAILIFSHTIVFPIAMAVICTVSLFEMYKCLGKHKNIWICLPAYIFSLAYPFLMRYVDNKAACGTVAFVCGALYLLFLFFFCVYSKGDIKFGEIGELFTATLYITVATNGIIYIRDMSDSGLFVCILIFIGAWVTDACAYFTGMLFGRHKLIPEVSPKKTVEGSIGGTLFCIASFVLYGVIIESVTEFEANYVILAISGLLAAVVSQIGDLIMSVIKREKGIKDYGNIFPGHGGMLDRFDSILAVSLVLSAVCFFVRLLGIDII